MIIGYARVSTQDQELGRQIQELQKYGCEVIYQEKISGVSKSRPELDKLLRSLQPGDTVVIHKLDRLGRSLQHLVMLAQEFKTRGIGFVSLNDNFNTTTSQGKLIFNIMASIAEFERDLISERTRSGMAFRKSQGVRIGRPDKSQDQAIITEVQFLRSVGRTIAAIAKEVNISVPTVHKILKNHS